MLFAFPLPWFPLHYTMLKKKKYQGFPGGSVVKNPPADAGDMGSIPDPGRFLMPKSN